MNYNIANKSLTINLPVVNDGYYKVLANNVSNVMAMAALP